MNGKFIEKYGNAWAEMDNETRMMVICSEIFDLREDVKGFKDICDTVKRHRDYFKGLFWAGGVVIATTLIWLISSILGLIK